LPNVLLAHPVITPVAAAAAPKLASFTNSFLFMIFDFSL
jgi:hypothetical protein